MTKIPNTAPPADELRHGLEAFETDDSILLYFDRFGEEGRRALLDVARDVKHDPPAHRSRAVFVLGGLAWRPAFKTLVTLLDDASASVRLNAIYACAETGGPYAVAPLFDIARNEKRPLAERVHALRPLARIGDEQLLAALDQWPCDGLPLELQLQRRESIAVLRQALPPKRC